MLYRRTVTLLRLSAIRNAGTAAESTARCTRSNLAQSVRLNDQNLHIISVHLERLEIVYKVKSESKIKGYPKLIDSMGNCLQAPEESLSRGISVDATPIKESGLPIIFVIGGPGVGKRTISSKVAQKYGFHSIVTSDIIRNEVSKRTERAVMMARLISEGRLVPIDIVVELITLKMLDNLQGKKGFIVSGFPREKLQCRVFDKEVKPPDLVLFLDVRNSVLSDRLMARSVLTTSRLTINFDYIKSQIKEFHKRNKPIVKYYTDVLVVIDAEYDLSTIVFNDVCIAVDNVLAKLYASQTEEYPVTDSVSSTSVK